MTARNRFVALRTAGFALLFVVFAEAFIVALGGCASLPAAKADIAPVTNAVAAIAAEVQDVRSQVGDVKAQAATIDQRVQNFDALTMRIMAAGPYLIVGLLIIVMVGYLSAKSGLHVGSAVLGWLRGNSRGASS